MAASSSSMQVHTGHSSLAGVTKAIVKLREKCAELSAGRTGSKEAEKAVLLGRLLNQFDNAIGEYNERRICFASDPLKQKVSTDVMLIDLLLAIVRTPESDLATLCMHRHLIAKAAAFFGSAGAGAAAGTAIGGPLGGLAGLFLGVFFGKKVSGVASLADTGKFIQALVDAIKATLEPVHPSEEQGVPSRTKPGAFFTWSSSLRLVPSTPGAVLCFHEHQLVCILTNREGRRSTHNLTEFLTPDELKILAQKRDLESIYYLILIRALLVLEFGLMKPEVALKAGASALVQISDTDFLVSAPVPEEIREFVNSILVAHAKLSETTDSFLIQKRELMAEWIAKFESAIGEYQQRLPTDSEDPAKQTLALRVLMLDLCLAITQPQITLEGIPTFAWGMESRVWLSVLNEKIERLKGGGLLPMTESLNSLQISVASGDATREHLHSSAMQLSFGEDSFQGIMIREGTPVRYALDGLFTKEMLKKFRTADNVDEIGHMIIARALLVQESGIGVSGLVELPDVSDVHEQRASMSL